MKIHSITLVTDAWRQTFQGAAGRRDDVAAELRADGSVALSAGATPVRFLRLRFDHPFFADTLFLGDAWERSYGDLQWRGMDPSRYLPWYFFARARGITEGIGVKVNPGALAVWTADPDGATLWLDVRSGSDGVVLDGRTLEAATVVHASYPGVPPFDAACRFCSTLSPAPLLPPFPVYGSNNWYYAYGKSSRTQILADCRTVAGYTEGLENRPFMVVDDGWQIAAGDGPDRTPWREGCAAFPDIPSLPAEMASHGVRPGIWCRPLWNPDPSLPDEWRIGGRGGESLDPSRPDVLDIVARDIRRISDWGFRLIKHDFTTFDIFGRWGFEMSDVPAPRDLVHLADRSRTSAETIASLYRTIRDAAGPGTLVLGCNTIGHLGAGLMHLARIGDDTSGRIWERTRRMGVNALAFRLCQHNRFFAADPDCVGIRGDIPMELNLQWAELVAKSSTVFFASVKPGICTPAEDDAIRGLFALASTQEIAAEPLDWLTTTTPEQWSFDGVRRRFHWQGPDGETPDFAE
ncbi:MAG: hypothetical protein ACOX5G_09970 [Kiritimatiellia bacterium]|jgi:alpha-galactosidase